MIKSEEGTTLRIHFIGIGGIGISALAQYFKFMGHDVSGSDIANNVITKQLQEDNIEIIIPHSQAYITSDIDLVVHSAIIKENNEEIIKAKALGIKTLSRKEALPLVVEDKKVFAVCGAHGKSTTTAILAELVNGSALIGAQSKTFQSNVRFEASNNLVFEADESDGSFVDSNPYCAIVTNAEPEHMENYDYDLEKFHAAYKSFLEKATIRVINAEDPFLSTLSDLDAVRLYPSKDIKNICYDLVDDEPCTRFELKDLGEFCVWGFGEHIAIDASLAILAAIEESHLDEVRENILNFRGIKKRFDIVNKELNHVIIDDYGHHPTEIEATMKSVNAYSSLKGFSNIVTIWQPHKYSRTLDNLQGFTKCFEGTKKLIILPVWSAGENKRDIDFEKEFANYNLVLADRIKRESNKVHILKGDEVLETYDEGVIVGFGAGDITNQIRGIV